MYDLLLTGATVVDPANQRHARMDVAISGGQIAAIDPEVPRHLAARVIDLAGKHLLPGIIDSHVHLCAPFGGAEGFRMLALAGVTTAFDLAGTPDALIAGMAAGGTGLSVGFVYPLIPGETIQDRSPSGTEIEQSRDRALAKGALGLKLLGGHYPLTAAATADAIRICHQSDCYLAVHAGTTTRGSNIEGLEELIDLAEGRPLHIAHINSYTRGQVTGDPVEEASRAIKALLRAPNAFSESYLATINGASAACAEGVATSNVVKTCLRSGGFDITTAGLEAAIKAGWAQIHMPLDGQTVLADPAAGLRFWQAKQTQTGISFAVNPPSSTLAVALAKSEGRFVVNALSTDGGAIPRNTIISQGIPLVKAGALSLDEFVTKSSLAPARWLGLRRKGHLSLGADADITVVDLASASPVLAVARGQVILENGIVTGSSGCLFTTEIGARYLQEQGVPYEVVERA